MTAEAFWNARWAEVKPEWRPVVAQIVTDAEHRRPRAKFNTGSISSTAALVLMAIAAWVKPNAIIEVGTFIGVSTLALAQSARVYTCDVSNNCLEPTHGIESFPYQTSTDMLDALHARGVTADLFFFDGLLSEADVARVIAVSRPAAVYVMDDYNGRFKGVANAEHLLKALPGYVLLPAEGPVKVDTTLAVLAPESRL